MMLGTLVGMFCFGFNALAAAEVEHRVVDVTAYTLPKGQWKVGLFRTDWGMSEHTSIGTRPLLWAVGANANIKVNLYETDRTALSIEGASTRVHQAWLSALTGANSNMALSVRPLSARFSWKINEQWSVHTGITRTNTVLEGRLTGDQINTLIGAVIGVPVDFSDALGVGTVYAGAQGSVWLGQGNFALQWQRRPNQCWILESNSYAFASGLIVGTVNTTVEDATVGAGAAAAFDIVLSSFPSATSIAWQRNWGHMHVRVGLPLSLANPLSYLQPFALYWLI